MRFVLGAPRNVSVRPVIGGDPDACLSPDEERVDGGAQASQAVRQEPVEHTGAQAAAAHETKVGGDVYEGGFEQGKLEGFDAGYREGFEQGRSEGLESGAQVLRERAEQEQTQTEALLKALTEPLAMLKSDLADAVTEGAQRLARLLVGEALELDAKAVTSVVADVLKEAAEVGGQHQVLRIYVPPGALESVRTVAEPQGAEVVVDPQLERGDVRATLAKNNGDPVHQIEWDARLETRWEAIRKALRLREG